MKHRTMNIRRRRQLLMLGGLLACGSVIGVRRALADDHMDHMDHMEGMDHMDHADHAEHHHMHAAVTPTEPAHCARLESSHAPCDAPP